jgi:hypothetical protein
MVHEFFRKGYGGINEPYIKHQEKENEEQEPPVPFVLQFCERVVPVPEMVYEKEEERDKG